MSRAREIAYWAFGDEPRALKRMALEERIQAAEEAARAEEREALAKLNLEDLFAVRAIQERFIRDGGWIGEGAADEMWQEAKRAWFAAIRLQELRHAKQRIADLEAKLATAREALEWIAGNIGDTGNRREKARAALEKLDD